MKYSIGMYGGKFMPFHKGHRYCVETACSECEKVYVILFYGGNDEIEILKNNQNVNDIPIRFNLSCKSIIQVVLTQFGFTPRTTSLA